MQIHLRADFSMQQGNKKLKQWSNQVTFIMKEGKYNHYHHYYNSGFEIWDISSAMFMLF